MSANLKLCRFQHENSGVRIGLLETGSTVIDLGPAGISNLEMILEASDPVSELNRAVSATLPRCPLADVTLHPPIEQQEVWAAGVTYLRSKTARMEESTFGATAYDRVYAADRPELFFKACGHKVAAPGAMVGIRRDARWSVPEPELALVINSRGGIAGYTVGNDMSSRDIEGDNLLYLPQAKVYDRSCALGPWIVLGAAEAAVRAWSIEITIRRGGTVVFAGATSVAQMKRSFRELADYLFRSQTFDRGAVLLTGTGVVPPDIFTLAAGDLIAITISGIGTLSNPVAVV